MLTISIHHENNFPLNSGIAEEIGVSDGEGYNLNIPLPAGCGIGAYLATLEQIVIPALKKYQPDLIVVACGFDAAALDPLGPMILNSQCYGEMTRQLVSVADKICHGRLVFIHEGGYSEGYVPFCGLATIEALSGLRSPVVDKLGEEIAQWGQQELLPHQQTVINKLKLKLEKISSPN